MLCYAPWAATTFSRPANPIAAPPSFQRVDKSPCSAPIIQRAGESHRRAAIISAGRQIPLPRHHLFSGPANPIAVRRNHFSVPANPIAAPQSFQWSGKSHCVLHSFQRADKFHRRAAIISAGRQIPSPRRNHFSRPANPIVAPPSFLQSSFNTVFCHSRHTSNFLICVGYHQNNISISKTNYPHHIPNSKNLFNHAIIYQWQKVIGIVPAAITPDRG